MAKKRHGKLNTIVMNAVMEACVHCGNVDAALGIFSEMAKPDGCGVDNITFATLLKVFLGLESVISSAPLFFSFLLGNYFCMSTASESPMLIFSNFSVRVWAKQEESTKRFKYLNL